MSGINVALAKTDGRNGPAVAAIALQFYGTLYSASEAAPNTSSTSKPAGTGAVKGTMQSGRQTPNRYLPHPILSRDELTAHSAAGTLIGNLLVTYCKASANVPNPNATGKAQDIDGICQSTQLLTDLAASTVRGDIISTGQSILAQVNNYTDTLVPPAPSGDPTTPPTLTLQAGTSGNATITPLQTQSLSQYFVVNRQGDGVSISHLSTKQYISVANNATVLSSTPFQWTITSQRLGGYAIFSPAGTVLSLSLTLVPFIPDGGNTSGQRWQLGRTGYYLQNQDQDYFAYLAAARPDNNVALTLWQPFSQSLPPNGPRSDAFNTWHLDKVGNGQYRLYNEHTGTLLRNSKDGNNNLMVAGDGNPSDADLWQFAKNGNDLWLQCQDPKQWMAIDKSNQNRLYLQDPGNKEPWKGWQLISVAATERGLLTSLPRYALVSSDQQVYSDSGLTQYMPDNSYQRYRSYTYGQNTIYINEATAKLLVLKNDGTLASTDLSNTGDSAVWWTQNDKNATISVATKQSLFTPVSNTGDLMPSVKTVRLQLANGQVVSVRKGAVVAEALDRFSTAQLWSCLDWQLG